MSAPESAFQSLLATLIANPSLVAELHTDPGGFAARHGANQADLKQLRQLDPASIRTAGSILLGKHLWRMAYVFPATAALLKDLIGGDEELVSAVATARVFRGRADEPFGPRLWSLMDLLSSRNLLPVLCDVIRVEVLWRDIQDRMATLPAEDLASPSPGGRPKLRLDIAVAAFGCPVVKVRRLILAGEPIRDIPMERCHYLLHVNPRDRTTGARRLLEKPGGVLESCDGVTTPFEMAARLGMPQADVDRVLQQATAAGFLTS